MVIYLRMAVTSYLLRPTRRRPGEPISSFLDLHRKGFSEPKDRSLAGELLPLLFTFACELYSFHRLCIFCATFHRITPPGRYPASCLLVSGLSSSLSLRPLRLLYITLLSQSFQRLLLPGTLSCRDKRLRQYFRPATAIYQR